VKFCYYVDKKKEIVLDVAMYPQSTKLSHSTCV
jgi:hypothetical protein